MKSKTKELLVRYGIPTAFLLLAGALAFGGAALAGKTGLREADTPSAGSADSSLREGAEGTRYLSAVCANGMETARALEVYTAGDGPAPAWYQPGEAMAVEWEDQFRDAADILVGDKDVLCNAWESDSNAIQRTDAGCPDWNVDSTLWGWDGHGAEAWELDLYARIVYLEFWGCSAECCEAGADSILRLWESGYFGRTLGETLSARTESGAYAYSTYPAVWATEYDAEGLREMRELCEDRFFGGPTWIAPFFQLYGFPDWAVPAYEIDGVFFSTGVQ